LVHLTGWTRLFISTGDERSSCTQALSLSLSLSLCSQHVGGSEQNQQSRAAQDPQLVQGRPAESQRQHLQQAAQDQDRTGAKFLHHVRVRGGSPAPCGMDPAPPPRVPTPPSCSTVLKRAPPGRRAAR
ncbi:hypothetical protein PHYPO_G00097720, partial [Pangasianodon hypophthalmus]